MDANVLLARAKAGDEAAFARIFEIHAALLAGRIRRVLPPGIARKVSVADILQEIRITALRRLPEFEPRSRGALRAWLLRIAEMKIGSALKRYGHTAKRSAGAEVTRGRRPETVEMRAPGRSPSQAAIAGEDARFVRGVLALLPDDYRHMLHLVFDEHLTLREAAERMGRSRDAAKKLYGRALARFTELARRARGGADV